MEDQYKYILYLTPKINYLTSYCFTQQHVVVVYKSLSIYQIDRKVNFY